MAAVNAGVLQAPAAYSQAYISNNVAHQAYAAPAYASYAAPALSYGRLAAPAHYASYAAPAVHQVAAYAAPIAKAVIAEAYAPAHYDFGYSVHDPHTGDIKEQKESRKGDVVQGSYSLVEPDGSRRVVEYSADAHNGFNAVVHRQPAQHAVAVKAVAPIVKYAAAPALAYSHAAPALAYGHAAPALAYGHAAPALAYGHAANHHSIYHH